MESHVDTIGIILIFLIFSVCSCAIFVSDVTSGTKAVFELTENHFRKLFSVKSTRLAATENRFSGKSFPFDQNLRLLTRKSFYILVLPSNDFRSCERNTLSQNT